MMIMSPLTHLVRDAVGDRRAAEIVGVDALLIDSLPSVTMFAGALEHDHQFRRRARGGRRRVAGAVFELRPVGRQQQDRLGHHRRVPLRSLFALSTRAMMSLSLMNTEAGAAVCAHAFDATLWQ